MPVLKQRGSKTLLDAGSQPSTSPTVLMYADALVTSAGFERMHQKHCYGRLDDKLIEWGWDPELLADEGITPPSKVAIAQARQFALWMQSSGLHCPEAVVSDGEGGIIFENRQGTSYERFEILADGTIYYVAFEDCKLIARDEVTN